MREWRIANTLYAIKAILKVKREIFPPGYKSFAIRHQLIRHFSTTASAI